MLDFQFIGSVWRVFREIYDYSIWARYAKSRIWARYETCVGSINVGCKEYIGSDEAMYILHIGL